MLFVRGLCLEMDALSVVFGSLTKRFLSFFTSMKSVLKEYIFFCPAVLGIPPYQAL